MSDAITVILHAVREWYEALILLLVLNLLWMGLSLTGVLMPPATAALYHITGELAYGRTLGIGDFFAALRRYFLRSWLWGAVNIIVLGLVAANLWFFSRWDAPWAVILYAVFSVIGLYWLIVQFYVWPYMMRQEVPALRLALRNSLVTIISAPLFTLILVLFVGVLVVLSLWLVFPLTLGVGALIALLGSIATRTRIEAFSTRGRVHERGSGEG